MAEEQQQSFDLQVQQWKDKMTSLAAVDPRCINPMVRRYGPDEKGRTCKDCRLLRRKTGYRNTYFKCALHGNTNGPATDHRMKWPACAQFVPRPQKELWTLKNS